MTSIGWDEHYATEAGARHWPNEELVRFLSGRQFKSALDAGAGTGSNFLLLERHAREVMCVEPNALARQTFINRCELAGLSIGLRDADIRKLPFRDGTYDLVVDCMTSQHVPWAEHEAVYREYARVLRPGGWLWLFHLDRLTSCGNRLVPGTDAMDCEWLSLFPTLSLFCLPPAYALALAVGNAGLEGGDVRGLAREYPNGDVAHYTIIAAMKPPNVQPSPPTPKDTKDGRVPPPRNYGGSMSGKQERETFEKKVERWKWPAWARWGSTP